MVGNQVMPVRAWAEYPEWSVYIQNAGELWDVVCVPKVGDLLWVAEYNRSYGLRDSLELGVKRIGNGPLQSLRVLLSNGETLTLGRANDWWWYWTLSDPPQIGGYADGGFEDDNDAEAVQRALTAAAAYFNPTREGE